MESRRHIGLHFIPHNWNYECFRRLRRHKSLGGTTPDARHYNFVSRKRLSAAISEGSAGLTEREDAHR